MLGTHKSQQSPSAQQGSPPLLLGASVLRVYLVFSSIWCSCVCQRGEMEVFGPSLSCRVCVACACVCALLRSYWKASRNMSTTLMMMSSIIMRNTTTFWVSGGRLQRSMVLRNPILCLLHLPEPLPRAISPLASSSSSFSSAPSPLLCRLSLSAEPPHHTASPRPPLRLSPSSSGSAAVLLRSAPALASSASPATLPIPSVAPACQWRLGALSVSACVNRLAL